MTLYVPPEAEELIGEDVTTEAGIFEIPALAGDYRLCVERGYCVPITVPVNGRVGVEFVLPLGGWFVRDAATCEE